MFHLLLESVVLEFDHYLAMLFEFQPQDDWDQVLIVKLYLLQPA
jgi:hypothetical protein